jgi:hypothetical protein
MSEFRAYVGYEAPHHRLAEEMDCPPDRGPRVADRRNGQHDRQPTAFIQTPMCSLRTQSATRRRCLLVTKSGPVASC